MSLNDADWWLVDRSEAASSTDQHCSLSLSLSVCVYLNVVAVVTVSPCVFDARRRLAHAPCYYCTRL